MANADGVGAGAPEPGRGVKAGADDSAATALQVIVVLLTVGAAWVLAGIIIPFVAALILAVALSPVASKLERLGLPRAVAALVCLLAVATVLLLATGLVVFEAGTIARDSDRYIQRFSALAAQASHRFEGKKAPAGSSGRDANEAVKGEQGQGEAGASGDHPGAQARWERTIRRGLRQLGEWGASGVGGLLGAAGGTVVALAFLFYMIEGREGWSDRLVAASSRLGLKPKPEQIGKVQHEVVTYLSCLAAVASAYVVVISLALWAIGVPEPVLWGVLAGLLEVVPYFGPLVASVLPTVVALSLGSWWQPAAVAGLFLTLHLVEGYGIAPLLYGRAVKLDPVTILLGAMFFGGIWGPVGLAVATPMVIILRGLLLITPDTPALDALAGVKGEKRAAKTASSSA